MTTALPFDELVCRLYQMYFAERVTMRDSQQGVSHSSVQCVSISSLQVVLCRLVLGLGLILTQTLTLTRSSSAAIILLQNVACNVLPAQIRSIEAADMAVNAGMHNKEGNADEPNMDRK